MKKYILFILVPLIIVLGFVTVDLLSKTEITREEPPIPKITMGGKEIPVVLGSYMWKVEVKKEINYDELIKNNKPFRLSPSSEITIDFGGYKPRPDSMGYGLIGKGRVIFKDATTTEGWHSDSVQFGIKNNTIKIQDAGKGNKIIYLTATWDSGVWADYLIPLEVK